MTLVELHRKRLAAGLCADTLGRLTGNVPNATNVLAPPDTCIQHELHVKTPFTARARFRLVIGDSGLRRH